MFGDDDLLALSGLQHIAYCERQWALIHLEQEWSDSFDTVRGNLFHARADTKGYSTLRGFRCERRVRLVSHSLGIYGIADIVEFGLDARGGSVRPVEYKVGKQKSKIGTGFKWRHRQCASRRCWVFQSMRGICSMVKHDEEK